MSCDKKYITRFIKGESETVAAGAEEIVFNEKARGLISQLNVYANAHDTTGEHDSIIIIEFDGIELFRCSFYELQFYHASDSEAAIQPAVSMMNWSGTTETYGIMFAFPGWVEERIQIRCLNADPTNTIKIYSSIAVREYRE